MPLSPWFAAQPRAEVVTVVLAVVQFAIAMAKMFAPQGPSTVDFLALQTELLKAISQQIVVLQKGMERVLTELAEIKRLIGEVPDKVVAEQCRAEMQGYLTNFLKAVSTSAAIKENKGIDEARRYLKARIDKEVIWGVRKTRNMMLPRENAIAFVPSMAAALLIELQTIIQSTGDGTFPDEEVSEILQLYTDWFDDVRTRLGDQSITGKIEFLRKSRASLVATAATLKKDVLCKTGLSPYHRRVIGYKKVGGKEGDVYEIVEYNLELAGKLRRSKYEIRPAPAQSPEIQTQFAMLVSANILRPSDSPVVLDELRTADVAYHLKGYEHEEKKLVTNTSSHPDLIAARGHQAIHNLAYSIEICSDQMLEPWVPPFTDHRQSLEHLNLQFMTLGNLSLVCRDCLSSLAEFKKARGVK